MRSEPNAQLFKLIYYSRNSLPGAEAEIAAEIEAVLATSQRNNKRAGITGALIFNSGIFAQVLEGSRCEVEATFERIQRDPRHGSVQILAFEPALSRSFPSWSMAFVGRSRSGEQLFSHIGQTSGFDARHMEGERVLSILRDIVVEEERSRAA